MSNFVFVTGNMHKVKWLEKFIGGRIAHKQVEVMEINSPLPEVKLEHKAREAYKEVRRPVVVDDVSLVFQEWGDMPGTFIKFFVEGPGLEKICRMLDGFDDRTATMRVSYGYFDGKEFEMVSATMRGKIADRPMMDVTGHGFDPILIPDGHANAIASMDEDTYMKLSPRGQAVQQLKLLLERKKQ